MILHRMKAQFGPLRGETLQLSEGMNLIHAPNEGGKSSWCAFLSCMLYGWDEEEGAQWLPWDGAQPEGELECSYQGERILLRRRSKQGAPMGRFSAVFLSDGRAVPGMTAARAGELLTGVSRAVFLRSVLIQQGQLPVEEHRQLAQCMAALVSTEGSAHAPAAQAALQRRRAEAQSESNTLAEEARRLQAQLEELWALGTQEQYAREGLEAARERFFQETAELPLREESEAPPEGAEPQPEGAENPPPDAAQQQAEAALEAARLRLDAMEEESTRLEEDAIREVEEQISIREREIRQRGWSFFGFCLLALVLAVAVMASTLVDLEQLRPAMLAAAVCFVGVVVLLVGLIRARLDRRDYREIDQLNEELEERYLLLETWDLEWEAALLREEAARQALELLSLRREGLATTGEWMEQARLLAQKEAHLALLQGRLRGLGEAPQVEAQLLLLQERLQALRREEAALGIALAALLEAEQALCGRLSPALNEQAGRYLAYLSGGAYEGMQVEPGFAVFLQPAKGGALRPRAGLSQGMRDMADLSLRLALADLLVRGGPACPLILDDALLRLDDAACLRALKLFLHSAEHRQLILLSGQRREAQLLGEDTRLHRQDFLRRESAAP